VVDPRGDAGRLRRRKARCRRSPGACSGAAAGGDQATLPGMSGPKIRLGGMALGNGVLVHGPQAWACAVRTDDGELKVVARRKRLAAASVGNPVLRGP